LDLWFLEILYSSCGAFGNDIPEGCDKDLYKSPHLIENFFAKLKQYRAIAIRYDKTSEAFLGAVYMAASVIWLN